MKSLNNLSNSAIHLFEAIFGRLQNRSASLLWGSHREELEIHRFVAEFLVEHSPKIVIEVPDPIIDGLIHRHSFGDRAICQLRDAEFDPLTGNVYVDNLLIRESHSGSHLQGIRPLSDSTSDFGRPIIGVPYQTHYHWIIESLPRIIAASIFEPEAILIAPTNLTRVQRQALEYLDREVFYTDKRCQSDSLILATRGNDSGWPHPLDLELLRRFYKVPTSTGANRFFISRANSRRGDKHSHNIDAYAKDFEWTVVVAEELSFADHLALFGSASVIAGEHGAGLANLVFAPLTCCLLELVNPTCANPCYAALSFALNSGLGYYTSSNRMEYKSMLSYDLP
jgi:hypothetical protein